MAEAALQRGLELSVAQVAELKGCSARFIRKLIAEGGLEAVQRLNERNRPAYYVPLAALDARLQKRYQKGIGGNTKELAFSPKGKPLERYSLEEQQKIQFWQRLLDEWQQYRNGHKDAGKVEADAQFVVYATVAHRQAYQQLFGKELTLSKDTLYRRWKALRELDYDGLLDQRGQAAKGKSSIPPMVWDAFMSFYLDTRQHPVARCYEYTRLWVQASHPELCGDIPNISSFYRRVERDIPEPLRVLGREGEKAFRDRCAPYIRRIYDEMESNEYWIADTHTLDVISNTGDGKQHRLYLVAFFDARSQIFVGCQITDSPSSQATLCALRKCIKAYGIPQNIYVDNGREFLTHDVGGLGHRAKSKHKDEFQPPPVFERLGITMINAIVRNARAKTIERRFRDIKDHLSRLFPTYTGGNVVERPEALKYNLKAGKIVADQELVETVGTMLRWYFNEQPYGGAVVKDRGKPRMQVYNENLRTKRVPRREEDLNLLMMRSSRLQKITRRGVHLTVGGMRYDFFNDEMLTLLQGQEVYFRYDPENLSEVRVYDKTDRLLTVAPVDNQMIQKYGAGKEDLAAAMREQRRYEKAVATMLEHSGLDAVDRIEAVNLILANAKEKSLLPQQAAEPKVIQLERVQEEPLYSQAVGYDLDLMLENAEKYHNGGKTDE